MASISNPIVIVEDDPMDVDLLRNALATLNLSAPIMICEDGAEAIAALQPMADIAQVPRFPLPRAVFIDLNLPRIGGLSVIRWIRQQPRLAGLFVIVVSGSENPADPVNAYSCGADEFIRKPADRAILRSMLRPDTETRKIPACSSGSAAFGPAPNSGVTKKDHCGSGATVGSFFKRGKSCDMGVSRSAESMSGSGTVSLRACRTLLPFAP